MHPSLHSLLVLLLCAACTTESELERANRDVEAHLAKVRAGNQRRQDPEPQQEPQQPERTGPKIDQIQPVVGGRRPYRGGRIPLGVAVEAGIGSVAIDVPGTQLDDRVATTQLRVGIDGSPGAKSGAGMQVRIVSSDDDLFAGQRINDGVQPCPADASVLGLGAFPHLRFEGTAASLPFVTRLGLAVDQFQLDHHRADVDRSWLTLGARLQTEPRYELTASEDGSLELFGRLGGQLGYGRFAEDYGVGQGDDWMPQLGLDAGLGLRWRSERWSAGLGYEYGRSWFGATDTSLFGERSSLGLEHQALFVVGGVRF